MRLIRREFEVDVPLEQAWRHLSRVVAWPSWARHIRAIEVEPSGELGLGSKGRIHLRNGVRSEFEVVEMEPGSRWMWVGSFLWLTVRYDHRFEALGARRTRLIWVVDAEGAAVGIFGRLFAAVYRRSMERAIPRLVEEMTKGERGKTATPRWGMSLEESPEHAARDPENSDGPKAARDAAWER